MPYFYATTPIYYVNDAPHVGHSYTTVTADAVARWRRILGDETKFLTGTDEHGLKVMRSAEANDRSPLEQANLNSKRFSDSWEALDISNDDFIRTTELRHHRTVKALMQKVFDNGYIYKDTYSGLYCVGCEAYYTEDDLEPGNICPDHKKPVDEVTEDNWFFKLSELEEPLLQWYEQNPDKITPEGFRNEALGIIKGGLRDISISRSSINWGVDLPWDEDHVFYVWYDALINYATAAGYGSDSEEFDKWWPNTHHFIGKDILRFHCVYWPALLIAAQIEPLPSVHVHGFLLSAGEKMSKSGNVTKVSPQEMIEVVGVDGFRHGLLRNHPFGPDSDFSIEGQLERYNNDLANSYGNLISRVAKVVSKKCDGIAPKPQIESPLKSIVEECVDNTISAWERIAPSVALEATWKIIRETNEYLAQHEPWKLEPGETVNNILGDALEAIRIATILAQPSIPNATAEAWQRIGLGTDLASQRIEDAKSWGLYPGGVQVEVKDPLFPRLKG